MITEMFIFQKKGGNKTHQVEASKEDNDKSKHQHLGQISCTRSKGILFSVKEKSVFGGVLRYSLSQSFLSRCLLVVSSVRGSFRVDEALGKTVAVC